MILVLLINLAFGASIPPQQCNITNSTLAVTGTFWQTTQPVSGTMTCNAGSNLNTSLLATESTLSTMNGKITACNTGAIAGTVTSNDGGTKITAATMPAGGVGLMGWMSAVYQQLLGTILVGDGSGPLTVDGTVAVSNAFNLEATQTAMSAKFPASLGAKTGATSFSVVPASDGFAVTCNAGTNLNTSTLATAANQTTELTDLGSVTETAPASDTASSGLNGRLQRIAQNITTLISSVLKVKVWNSPTYTGTNVIYTPPATPTDMVILCGSGTKTIRVLKATINCLQTTAGTNTFFLLFRTAANTAGTLISDTMVAHDQNNAAATATLKHYTVNPTSVGAGTANVLRSPRIMCPAAATAVDYKPYEINFDEPDTEPVTLRGTAQCLAWNFAGVALPAGLAISMSFTTSEE